MGKSIGYREYNENGNLIKLECNVCHEIKTVDEFYKTKNRCKDGIVPRCKKCICKKQQKYQSEHKEERKEYNKKYQQNNKEKLKEYGQQYRENNKEKLREINKNYYEENKEEIIKHNTEYKRKNRDKSRLWNANYREKHREDILEKTRLYQQNNREKVRESNRKYYNANKEKESERKRKYRENNMDIIRERERKYRENNIDVIRERSRQWYKNHIEEESERKKISYTMKVQNEIIKIYENVTKQLYPHKGIQYGNIYGVHCIPTDRWYIGQTITSFKIRSHGDFFNYKTNELSNDSIKGKLLHDDIEKYGQENFEIFEVLDVAFSEKELDEKESYYIDYYKAYDEGYNSNRGNIFKHNKSKRKEVI